MIAKAELKRIATARLKDAEILLKAKRFDGASYLSGYAVEIGLKLRICKTLKWSGFPETKSEFQDYQTFRTHDLDRLLHLSGMEDRIKSHYFAEWSDLKPWKPEMRYIIRRTAASSSAADMIKAAKILLKIL